MTECRKRIWIDHFQTGLLVRIVVYCMVYQVAVWAFFGICEMLDRGVAVLGGEVLFFSTPLVRNILVLVCIAPPLMFDAVRFAHRLVGPLYRFRKTVQAIAAGEPVALVQLRKGDLLMDLKDDFNVMLRQLEQRGLVVLKGPVPAETSDAAQAIASTVAPKVAPNS